MSNPLVCSGNIGCKSEVLCACLCGDPVTFLCKGCVISHLSELSAHTFISLDQAQDLLLNRITSSDHAKVYNKYNDVKIDLESYLRNIKSLRVEILTFKQEIINLIDQKCSQALENLQTLQESTEFQLSLIKQRLLNFKDGQDELLSIFESKGLSGIIQDYLKFLSLEKDQVISAVENMIIISNNPSQSYLLQQEKARLQKEKVNTDIYHAKPGTKSIIHFNSIDYQVQEIDLSNTVSNNFRDTSTRILPDGTVIIVAGGYPVHGDTYKLHEPTKKCIKLKGLNTPRCGVHLYCHGDYLYALGGYNGGYCANVERIKWEKNGWEILPDMKQGRAWFGSYYYDSKLYCIGGWGSDSIEYYDFRNNSSQIVPNIKVPGGPNIVEAIEDRIYILSRDILVLDKSLQPIKDSDISKYNEIYSLGDTVIKDNSILFYNQELTQIALFNTKARKYQVVVSI
jgi:hypothetical protein